MATQGYCLSSKNNHDSIVGDTLNAQLNNLNLNQNLKGLSVADTVCSVFKADNRKLSNYGKIAFPNLSDFTDSKARKNSKLWNKSDTKKLPFDYLSVHNASDKETLKQKDPKSANNSTLSLHIAAYENAIEASNDFSETEMKGTKSSLIKKLKNAKQIFDGSSSSVLQNPFEFPRQQENDDVKQPEVMQFKASQRLLNPNASSTPRSNQRRNSGARRSTDSTKNDNQQLQQTVDGSSESATMVKKPIKTIDDIQKLMKEKQQEAEKKRQEIMASGDAQPNGVSAAGIL
uniref:Uncharacterized protein n=1 Tax=Panagrolaimus sp. ES5 TaxID=591445 RepID=A0AC34G583_9BILA